jgi:hypothetical protein
MQLSEAIRLGSLLKPQAFGVLFRKNFGSNGTIIITSCALGAAVDAVADIDANSDTLIRQSLTVIDTWWPWVNDINDTLVNYCYCPECGQTSSSITYLITHFNDRHRWSREKIADWVVTAEPPEVFEEKPRILTEFKIEEVVPEYAI